MEISNEWSDSSGGAADEQQPASPQKKRVVTADQPPGGVAKPGGGFAMKAAALAAAVVVVGGGVFGYQMLVGGGHHTAELGGGPPMAAEPPKNVRAVAPMPAMITAAQAIAPQPAQPADAARDPVDAMDNSTPPWAQQPQAAPSVGVQQVPAPAMPTPVAAPVSPTELTALSSMVEKTAVDVSRLDSRVTRLEGEFAGVGQGAADAQGIAAPKVPEPAGRRHNHKRRHGHHRPTGIAHVARKFVPPEPVHIEVVDFDKTGDLVKKVTPTSTCQYLGGLDQRGWVSCGGVISSVQSGDPVDGTTVKSVDTRNGSVVLDNGATIE